MISQLEIYHDDPLYAIKEKINEIVDVVNALDQGLKNHIHGYEDSNTSTPLTDEHGSVH